MKMRFKKKVSRKSTAEEVEQCLLNTLLNKIPNELHIPGFKSTSPGAILEKHVSRGETRVNSLEESCKIHDIAYTQTENMADKILEKAASKKLTPSKSSIDEKMEAPGLKSDKKIKRKLGMGLRKD